MVDTGLFDQVAWALLDNAVKYSFSESTIEITSSTQKREFRLTIKNVGLRIKPAEAPRAVERGWRGEEAILTTAEGLGLGLWLANSIAKALSGKIEITPTTPENQTAVSLILPVEEHKE